MNLKRISGHLLQSAVLMACVNAPVLHAQNATNAVAATPASVEKNGDKGGHARSPEAASTSGLRLVEREAPGRDAQGNMRIRLIDGGIKRPAKL